jgi:hypothetical protein
VFNCLLHQPQGGVVYLIKVFLLFESTLQLPEATARARSLSLTSSCTAYGTMHNSGAAVVAGVRVMLPRLTQVSTSAHHNHQQLSVPSSKC